ncbi:unnamed protein product [Rotaria sp. Silwood2]|nr:unnamed protein product [Rotaria sp. Silwood2]CAF4645231.1 unnamed protein product [Rotaria sp. Silwood2]
MPLSLLFSSSVNNIDFDASDAERKPTVKLEYFPTSDIKQSAPFRDTVRKQTIQIKNQEILTECDSKRNEILPESDVQLEDQRDTNKATMKFSNPEMLRREQTLVVEKTEPENLDAKNAEETSTTDGATATATNDD